MVLLSVESNTLRKSSRSRVRNKEYRNAYKALNDTGVNHV